MNAALILMLVALNECKRIRWWCKCM